jgi:hypothetical protein
MLVLSVAGMLADMIVAIKPIALVALRFHRIVTEGSPILLWEMMRDGSIAGLMLGVHAAVLR